VTKYSRWNFQVSDDELLVCKGEHDKHDECIYQKLDVNEILDILNDMRSRLISYDSVANSLVNLIVR